MTDKQKVEKIIKNLKILNIKTKDKDYDYFYNNTNEYMKIIKGGNSKIPVEIVTIIEKSTDKVIVFITNYVSTFLSKVTQTISALPTIGIYTFITLLATYFICTDKMYIIDTLEHQLPKRWAKKIGIHSREIIKSLGGYLKAEAILIIISFFIVLIGLYILQFLNFNVPYPFLAALGIGFVDALPILRLRNGDDTLGNYCSYQWRF